MSLGQHTQEFMLESWDPDNPETVNRATTSNHTALPSAQGHHAATTPAQSHHIATTPAQSHHIATTPARSHHIATTPAQSHHIATTPARSHHTATSSAQNIDSHTADQLLVQWNFEADAPLGPDTCAALNATWDWENEELALGDETIDLLNESWDDDQVGGAGGGLPSFHMSPIFQHAVPRLGTIGRAFRVTFENIENLVNVYTFFMNLLQEIIDRAFGEANDNDLVGMEIIHPGLTLHRGPIIIRFRPLHMLTAEMVWAMIEEVLQSNKDFTLDDDLVINTIVIANPHGAGPGQYDRRKIRYNLDEWIQDKRSAKGSCVVTINNTDNLCLARAIVTGIARCERILNSEKRKEWLAIKEGDKKRQTRQLVRAKELMIKAGLGCHRGGCGREHFDALQQAISPRFRLRVTDAQCMLSVVYCGGTQGEYIDVLLHNGHFDLITSMAAFFAQSSYCDFCKTGYKHRDQHSWCGHRCPCCYSVHPCDKDKFINCIKCHRWFVSQTCFDNHAKVTTYAPANTEDTKRARCETSVCATVQRCEGCGKTLHIGRKEEDKKHECGMTECRFCKDMVDPNDHFCFMQPIEDKPNKKKKKSPTCYIYYDFETSQDHVFGENAEGFVFKHNVNCVNMRKCCDWCYDKPADASCLNCGDRNKTWVGDKSLTDFCKWLFSAKNKDSVALAHNASGFDGQFILDYLHKQAIAPEIITRGLSIISIGANGGTLLDSMCFMPMALASMPKAFGIPASKGYFPHLFNSKDNWHYEGPLPDAWFYGPGSMKAGARDEFYKWYNSQSKTEPFNLQVELVRYCQMDVEILMKGCMTFRRLLLDLFSVDPFTTSSTIPGTCMHIYRKMFMPLESIGIVPHGGYRKHDKHSIIAIKWLKYISETESLDIQHAMNGGEVRIGRWKVDGQLRGTKQLYEFNGCVYHGCPHCFPNRKNILPRKGVTADEAYQSTMDRQQDLERQGYTVRVMWECELNRMLKADKEMADYFKNLPIHDPLDPREAFFGGRTNAIKLYHKIKDGEKIYYMDICSLYPWTNKYMPFPMGHPTIITENFQPINKTNQPYQGLIKCRVCPPRRLLHPVLPLKSGHKLVFPLCKPCADSHFQGKCTHSDDERSFWGTWTHVEIYKAVERGYKVVDIAEVYHWDDWSVYDGENEDTGLFTSYINACLKLKQRVAGRVGRCIKCHRWFVSQTCFDNHAKVTTYAPANTEDTKRARCETSVCATVQRCEGCGKTLHIGRKEEDKKHECGMTECRFCKDMVDPNDHFCFMQPIEDKPNKKKKKSPTCYIYYDFETSQDHVFGENAEGFVFKHNVNCVNMRKCCDWCYDKPADASCLNCGDRNKTWVGDKSLTDFCKWLFSAKNKDSVALAHNASGFDGQFILDYLHKQAIAPEIITRGLSIISIGANGGTLLDSMCFMPMALASMPKAFGIPASKGYFPHLFNSKDNWHYEGPLPDAWFYGPGSMKAGARDEFYKWYNSQSKTEPFNLQVELVRYCQMDVEILMKGCMTFRRLLLDLFSVDPFTTSSTIPGTCMHIYRKMFMPLESIGIVPHGGYRKHDKHSIIAIKWLKYISETESLDIQHAMNGGEVRIGRWKVDGQLRGTKQLYEFNGCVYHGCPHCFPNRKNILPRKGVTADEAYQSTMDRQQDLERQGYTVRVMWECELNRMLKADKEMADYFKNLPIHDPLDPREAFFGGRTNAIKLYHKIKDGEKIYYMDICSLYPWTNKYMPFPMGHPTIITENFQPINKTNQPYQGLIKCRVCPPRRLLHPVLPLKSGHKLVFPLCKPCADSHFQGKCTHSDDERSFWGTWTHVEIYKAVERGYKVVDIAEVYHWDDWSVYDGENEDTGLFTSYINACLKLKQQASGWPSWAVTDEQKEQYIKQYMDKEGIQLDWDKIETNPALRSLAKLMLNSFWGKFGQRCTLSKTEYFTEPIEYYGCVFDACNDVASVRIVHSDMVCATYEKVGEYVEEQNHTNPVIAAYVTAHARLKLLSYLEPLGRNVLYFDTDSVIFVHRDGEYMPPTGDFLGDMTDELGGDHIVEYVSGGPKVYSYKTNTGTSVFKMRGVTVDATVAVKFNHRSLKKQVITFLQSGDRGHIDAVSNRIARNADRSVVTKTMRKKYQVTYDKRRVMKSGFTLPYGY